MRPLGVCSFLRPDLTRPLNRAAIWGMSLFGPTLSRRPQWAYGDRDMKRGRQYGVASFLLSCGVLAACSDEPIRPAPVFLNGGPGMAATRSSAAKPATPDSRFVVVGPGQSLGGIAEANHVPKQAIIAANHLSPPYKLKNGQMLRLPVSVAVLAPSRDKATAVASGRSRHSTVLADTRSSKHVAPEEVIQLDDPTPPRTAGSAATPAHSNASDQTTWVSPAPATPSPSGAR
jgi:LysM repeat protein